MGGEHPQVAASLNNLALHYDAQGKLDEAEPLYLKALGIMRDTLGAGHPDVAASHEHLGVLYTVQGKYNQAESHLQQALPIRRNRLGAAHPLVAQSLENYAALLSKTGREVEAKRAQILAASIRAQNARDNQLKPEERRRPQKRVVHVLKTTG